MNVWRRNFAAWARAWKAELLHCNQFAWVGCCARLPSLLAVHSDVVSWWRAVHGGPPPETAFHRWYRALAQQALERASLVASPTAAALAELRRSFGFRGPAHVAPNGAEPPPPAPGPRAGAVCVGRLWDEGKQMRLLLRSDLAMDTVLAGAAAAPPGSAHPPPRHGRLRYVGELRRPQVAALLARARLYVAPSRYEPFGLAPLEAALAGCCLLLNDLASFREVWGDAAYFFYRDDGDDMARWMRRLACQPALLQAGATAAAVRARCRYTAAAMAGRYEALYHRLLPPPAPPR